MGYQFSYSDTTECPVCDGSGSVSQTITASVDDPDTYIERALAWVRQQLPTISFTAQCSNCDGTGTCTETRPLMIDELSDRQMRFLHAARREREQAKWGDNDSAPSGGHRQQPDVSRPSPTAPPIQGARRQP